jgi:PAS domain-containing protein
MHLSLRTQLTLGLIAVMTLLAAVGTLALRELRVAADHTETLAVTSVPETQALGQISTQVYAVRSSQADLVAGGRRRVAAQRPIVQRELAEMREAIARYRAAVVAPDARRRLAGFETTWTGYVHETAGLADEVQTGDGPGAEAVFTRPSPLFLSAIRQLQALTDTEHAGLRAAVASAKAGASDARRLTIELTIAGLLLCCAVAVAVRRVGGREITMLSGFRSAFEHGGYGGALLDGDGIVLDVNRTLCDILQRPADAVRGRAPATRTRASAASCGPTASPAGWRSPARPSRTPIRTSRCGRSSSCRTSPSAPTPSRRWGTARSGSARPSTRPASGWRSSTPAAWSCASTRRWSRRSSATAPRSWSGARCSS